MSRSARPGFSGSRPGRPDRYRHGRLQQDAEPVQRLAPPGCRRAVRVRAVEDDDATDRDSLRYAQIYVAIMVVYGIDQLARYASGGGEVAFYGRDDYGRPRHARVHGRRGRDLDGDATRSRQTQALWWAGIVVGTAVVALSFRRYAWVELATVFAASCCSPAPTGVATSSDRSRVAVACGVTIALTWSRCTGAGGWRASIPARRERTTSTRPPTRATSTTSSTGWDQVRAHPITGLGVGVLYHATRTARWKGDAGMVHNAPVEVWIKFGLLGVIVFFAVYFILFRDIWRRRRRPRSRSPGVWRRRVPAGQLRRHLHSLRVAFQHVRRRAS